MDENGTVMVICLIFCGIAIITVAVIYFNPGKSWKGLAEITFLVSLLFVWTVATVITNYTAEDVLNKYHYIEVNQIHIHKQMNARDAAWILMMKEHRHSPNGEVYLELGKEWRKSNAKKKREK